MRLPLGMVCAGAAIALASAAQADPVFDTFKSICIDTHASAAGSLTAAEKLGWTPVPQPMLAKLKPSGNVTDVDGRMTTTKQGLQMMLVGRGTDMGPLKVQAQVCAIAAVPGDGEGLKAAAAAFAAVPADETLKEPGSIAYVWRDEAGGHKQVDTTSLKSATALNAMVVNGDATRGMIMLAVPTNEPN